MINHFFRDFRGFLNQKNAKNKQINTELESEARADERGVSLDNIGGAIDKSLAEAIKAKRVKLSPKSESVARERGASEA